MVRLAGDMAAQSFLLLSKTSACGLVFMTHELLACRSTAESMPRFFRPILSPYTSLATAGFAPFVSRHWPVSAPFPLPWEPLQLTRRMKSLDSKET
jgi:hypothetical protein